MIFWTIDWAYSMFFCREQNAPYILDLWMVACFLSFCRRFPSVRQLLWLRAASTCYRERLTCTLRPILAYKTLAVGVLLIFTPGPWRRITLGLGVLTSLEITWIAPSWLDKYRLNMLLFDWYSETISQLFCRAWSVLMIYFGRISVFISGTLRSRSFSILINLRPSLNVDE